MFLRQRKGETSCLPTVSRFLLVSLMPGGMLPLHPPRAHFPQSCLGQLPLSWPLSAREVHAAVSSLCPSFCVCTNPQYDYWAIKFQFLLKVARLTNYWLLQQLLFVCSVSTLNYISFSLSLKKWQIPTNFSHVHNSQWPSVSHRMEIIMWKVKHGSVLWHYGIWANYSSWVFSSDKPYLSRYLV